MPRATRAHQPSDAPLRAIIYKRQSAQREESISLELQETACREHCRRQGYRIVDIVADQITGQVWDKRPGILKVMKAVQSGEVDRVILYRWSRISRRRLHQAQAIHAIEEVGAEVESATEPFDTKTAAGEFGRDMMLDFAVFQGKLLGEQWAEAHERRHQKGIPARGGRRWGYILANGVYTPNPELLETDLWRYRQYVAGRGFAALSAELNRQGIYNAFGRPWSADILSKNMDSGFSAGMIAKNTNRGFRNIQWIPGAHEPNVDAKLWADYQRARRIRYTTPPRTIEPVYPLSGLVYCSDCGYNMYPVNRGGTPGINYVCGRYRLRSIGTSLQTRRRRVEDAVLAWLRTVSDDVNKRSAGIQVQRATPQAATDAVVVARAIADIDRQLKNLTLKLAADVIPESAYIAARDELMQNRAVAQARLDRAEDAQRARVSEPRTIARRLVDHWDVLAVRDRRALLARLVAGILVLPSPGPPTPAGVLIVPVWGPPE